jgi:hypothetical protein
MNKQHFSQMAITVEECTLMKIAREAMRVKFARNLHLRCSAWLEFPLKKRHRRHLI